MIDWGPIWLTFQLALITTVLLLLIGVPLAYWLAFAKSRWKTIWEAVISLPLVLPPTVLGFYLLIVFSPNQGLGLWLNETFGIKLVFSFAGLVLGSMIYSLPFMVHPLQAGFANLPNRWRHTSALMGKNQWETLKSVLLPNMKPAILTAIVLSFAHTIGEFGVVLMIGGNIPNKTKVASIAIYEEVETLNYATAHQYSLILFAISFLVLILVYSYNRNYFKKLW